MPGLFIGAVYSIPSMALARVCCFVLAFVLTIILKLLYVRVRSLQEIIQTPTLTSSSSGHYILDLRPEYTQHGGTRKRSTPSRLIRGGYFIPTIALANTSQILLTTSRELSSKCLYSLRVALLTVLGAVQLKVYSDTPKDPPPDNVQCHYIFDLRSEYGSDITEMLSNVLENNRLGQVVPYCIRKRRKRSKPRKFIKKSGWRLELVNPDCKKGAKKSNNTKHESSQSSSRSASAKSNSCQSLQPPIQYNGEQNVQDGAKKCLRTFDTEWYLEEQFYLEGPIPDSDKEVDVVPSFKWRTDLTCISCK